MATVVHLLTADAILPDPGAQRAGIETEEHRRPVLPLDAPPGFLEHLENVVLFQSDEGLDVLAGQFPFLAERVEPVHDLERGPLAGDDRPLDDTFQLPHVAGPVVFLEDIHDLFGHGLDLLAHLLVEGADKVLDEQRDVFHALPQGGDRDREHVEPVEQVFPEPAALLKSLAW